jgi:hypothetical protein
MWVRYLKSFRETIEVRQHPDGHLYAEHVLKLFGMRTMKMRYEMRRPLPPSAILPSPHVGPVVAAGL